MTRLGHVKALDGIRGVAILLVLGRHAFPSELSAGGYGVDLFFVLSGFLITTLLLEERDETGRISLNDFYRRRARRLFPALAVMLVAFVVVEIAKGHTAEGLRTTLWGGFYTANIAQAWFPGAMGYRLPLGVLWSLAQEEQFYLLAPLALILFAWRRVPNRLVMGFLGLLIVAVIAEGVMLSMREGGQALRIYAGPDTHSGGLLAGTLLAFALRRPAGLHALRFNRRLGDASLLLLVPLVVILWQPFAYQVPFVTLAAAGLITTVVCQPKAGLTQLLSRRVIGWFGRISYSLYLWHWFMLWLFNFQNRGVALLVAVAVAYASTRWIEEPIRRRRHRAVEPSLVPVPAVS